MSYFSWLLKRGRVYKIWFVLFGMEECIFCRIVRGEIPYYKVWSTRDDSKGSDNDGFVAFLDINPWCRGHVVVIPKGHSRWVWDVEDYSGYMDAVGEVVEILRKAFGTDYVQSAVVGEDVGHCHVHLFPRTNGDGLPAVLHAPMSGKVDMEEVLEKIKDAGI